MYGCDASCAVEAQQAHHSRFGSVKPVDPDDPQLDCSLLPHELPARGARWRWAKPAPKPAAGRKPFNLLI